MGQVWDMDDFTGSVRLVISFNSLYRYHLNMDIHIESFAELSCNWENRDTFKCLDKMHEMNEMGVTWEKVGLVLCAVRNAKQVESTCGLLHSYLLRTNRKKL